MVYERHSAHIPESSDEADKGRRFRRNVAQGFAYAIGFTLWAVCLSGLAAIVWAIVLDAMNS